MNFEAFVLTLAILSAFVIFAIGFFGRLIYENYKFNKGTCRNCGGSWRTEYVNPEWMMKCDKCGEWLEIKISAPTTKK